MATHEPEVELFYDPADLDPNAPRLYVTRNGVGWELRDGAGLLLSTHPTQAHGIEAARRQSLRRFSEILVRGSNGAVEWRLDQDPDVAPIVDWFRKRDLAAGEANG
ncbi:DUF2188 domain-containing protein [Longimicrobium sp.]|uniref:DUF2188 domain-containing protein n=1 Tax=Longimicrobium sp. TaxID=2029185 RepID=UPI002E34C720|nr:DUF2188 domain-containing protein [Longimicrobium sp.]HEX6041258.1 DUF2188 domain-containing protein [Longimicrobium sp.]